jgi:cyclomaltodextrinase
MDFAFGTYTNDALKLANHRANRNGIQHQNHITPSKPRPDEPVTVHVVTSGDSNITQVALYYTTDETTPAGHKGVASNGTTVRFEKTHVEWDSNVWDYIVHWQTKIPAQSNMTLVQYVISGWTTSETDANHEIFADYPIAQENVQHAAMIYFKNIPEDSIFTPSEIQQPHVFAYHVDNIQPPQWAYDAVIYQIFIDRFYHGDGGAWNETESMSDIFGGTLWGVRDKLDYIAELGVDCIWLSPTWLTPSSHGYDVMDYDRIEPRIGGEDALRAVVDGAHKRGMRVLLDLVCNHISNEHPYFLEALNNPESPYRDWFFFGDEFEHGYKGFFNVKTMPELNLDYPPARDWMIENAVRHLRDFNVDGYRLDYANGPSPDFWTYFRRACKAQKPDCLIFGEIIEPPEVLRRYQGRLDGCLDFPLNDALRRTYGWRVWSESQLQSFISNHRMYLPDDFIMPVFIDNHDMDRFSHIADNDSERLKHAVQVQMQQPQPIIIYYGCEVGLVQPLSTREHTLDVSRVPMAWDATTQNLDTFSFYKSQIRRRKL